MSRHMYYKNGIELYCEQNKTIHWVKQKEIN